MIILKMILHNKNKKFKQKIMRDLLLIKNNKNRKKKLKKSQKKKQLKKQLLKMLMRTQKNHKNRINS